jgi:hypothetical protein
MPRYLRWLAAVTTGIIVQFSFFIAVGAAAVGTGNKQLSGGVGLLVSLGSALVPMLSALAVNDWLRTRYPEPARLRHTQEISS